MKTRAAFLLAAVVTQIDYVDPDTQTTADFTALWSNNNNGQVVGNAVFNGNGLPSRLSASILRLRLIRPTRGHSRRN